MTTVEKPIGLAYMNDVIDDALQDRALKYLDGLKDEAFHTITGRGKNHIRIGYGRPEKGEDPVPDELKGLALAIFTSLKSWAEGDLVDMLVNFDVKNYRLTVNKYEPGWGLGDHYDTKAGENAIVIGLTIAANPEATRRMMFTKKEKNVHGKKIVHAVLTRPQSAYVFWKDGYTGWQHGSKADKKQKGRVYSITFRSTC